MAAAPLLPRRAAAAAGAGRPKQRKRREREEREKRKISSERERDDCDDETLSSPTQTQYSPAEMSAAVRFAINGSCPISALAPRPKAEAIVIGTAHHATKGGSVETEDGSEIRKQQQFSRLEAYRKTHLDHQG